MAGGLYSSLFGKSGQGLYEALYSKSGSPHQVKRFESRLGHFEGRLGQDAGDAGDEDDEDDEEDAPSVAPAAPGKPFFSRDFAGIPLWLLGVCFLGFSYAYRRKAKASGSSK